MRKTITTELFKKIMALAKELGLPVNLGTRTNVIPHPAYKDLTTSFADEARLQMTPAEDVKSIFELSLARIAQIDEAGGNTLLHNLQTLKKLWKPPENVVQYMDPKGLGGTKIIREHTAARKRMKDAGFDPDSNADQLKFMDREAASKKAGTDKGVGSLMKTKTEIIPPATEGDVGAKVIDEVPFEDLGLMQQSKSLMDEVQKLSDMTKGISAQERTQINKKEMSDFLKELKEKDYAPDEIAELMSTEHTLNYIKQTLLPRTDKARGFGARTKPQKDLVRDLEDSIEMYAQDDPDYLTQKYLNQKDMNYAIREAVEADLKATGKFTDDELYDLTTHNMNIDQGTNDFLMEVGTTIKLQGKGELFFPQFYENMATHYLGPIKDTIPFARGGIAGLANGGQLVTPNIGPRRVGYGGPQDWGQEKAAEKAHERGETVGRDNPYSDVAQREVRDLNQRVAENAEIRNELLKQETKKKNIFKTTLDKGIRGAQSVFGNPYSTNLGMRNKFIDDLMFKPGMREELMRLGYIDEGEDYDFQNWTWAKGDITSDANLKLLQGLDYQGGQPLTWGAPAGGGGGGGGQQDQWWLNQPTGDGTTADLGPYYGYKEWADWEGAPTTPMFGEQTEYKELLNEGGRVGYQPGGIILKKGARWFIKSIRKNLDDMLANHPRYDKIPSEEKDLLAQQFQTLIHSLEAGDEVPKEALEAIYKNPQYYKTPRVQRGAGDPDMVEVEELIKEKLLPDISDELINFETIGRKPNAYGGGVGSMFRRV